MSATWCSPRVTCHGRYEFPVGSSTPERPTRHQGRLDPSPGAARPVARGGSAGGGSRYRGAARPVPGGGSTGREGRPDGGGSPLEVPAPPEAVEPEGSDPRRDHTDEPTPERLLQQLAERRVEAAGFARVVLDP